VTDKDLQDALLSAPLGLGVSMYLYVDGGKLVMAPQKPAWAVTGTKADGKMPTAAESCGKSYDVMGKQVCTSSGIKTDWPYGANSAFEAKAIDYDDNTDGKFPGWPFKTMPKGECRDEAIWTPSSGYNNYLGVLEFRNSCDGGGTFAQPN